MGNKQYFNDFKKYHVFLDNIDLLSMSDDIIMFNDTILMEINVLDSYTLSEVNDIINILKSGESGSGKRYLILDLYKIHLID